MKIWMQLIQTAITSWLKIPFDNIKTKEQILVHYSGDKIPSMKGLCKVFLTGSWFCTWKIKK